MPSPDLSSRQLRAFVALADSKSFTNAARQCNLSQPAFSAAIKALETSLSTRLFERDTRSVRLTPEGQLFELAARRLLDDMGGLLGDLADHVERRKGRVRIAVMPSLAAAWMPPILAEFAERWPGISVSLRDALSEESVDLVRAGQVDFAIASFGSALSPELEQKLLCTDRFHLVCRADHPLAAEKRITPEKIARYPFIQMARNDSVRQLLESALRPNRLNVVYEVEHQATILGLVEAGLGVSVLPTLTIFNFKRDAVVIKPMHMKTLSREIYVVQRREDTISVAAQTMYDLVMERIGGLTFK